jgi:hypothetical protein
MNCHVEDALEQLNQAEYGDHYIIIYPNLVTQRRPTIMYNLGRNTCKYSIFILPPLELIGTTKFP